MLFKKKIKEVNYMFPSKENIDKIRGNINKQLELKGKEPILIEDEPQSNDISEKLRDMLLEKEWERHIIENYKSYAFIYSSDTYILIISNNADKSISLGIMRKNNINLYKLYFGNRVDYIYNFLLAECNNKYELEQKQFEDEIKNLENILESFLK